MRKPYELLVRYGIDGTIQGAHAVYQDVIDLGNGPQVVIGQPMPLTLAGPEFDALVSEAMKQASATAEALRAELATAHARIAALEAQP